ncbi:MAG TPA: HlyD family secretion protein [Bryobacteraceae bacterium]|nr:HlyD family secretion protein [Bryobacteraceae bacterium]
METKTLDYETDRELEAAARGTKAREPERIVRGPKQSLKKLAILGGLLAIVAVGVFLWSRTWDRESTDDAQVDGHIAPVAPKIAGNVTEVLVNDNQQVKQGQVLVRIDPRDYQAKVDQARAALAVAMSQSAGASAGVPLTRETTSSGTSSAQAQVASAQADYERAKVDYQRSATADVATAQANADTAQANYDRAQADLNRMRPLAAKEEISKLQFDGYVASARMAEGELKAAKDKVSAAVQESETKKAAVAAAQARVAQAEAGVMQARATQGQVKVQTADAASASANVQVARANLNTAELNLSYATIAAPLDGVVTKKSVEMGQMVQPGQGLLMIVPLNDVWVTANFKETQLRDVRVGQRAEVKIDLAGKTYPGRVDSIAGATGTRMSLLPPENATGNYVKVVQRIPVKIVLDPIPGGNAILRPGMNAEATILTK